MLGCAMWQQIDLCASLLSLKATHQLRANPGAAALPALVAHFHVLPLDLVIVNIIVVVLGDAIFL